MTLISKLMCKLIDVCDPWFICLNILQEVLKFLLKNFHMFQISSYFFRSGNCFLNNKQNNNNFTNRLFNETENPWKMQKPYIFQKTTLLKYKILCILLVLNNIHVLFFSLLHLHPQGEKLKWKCFLLPRLEWQYYWCKDICNEHLKYLQVYFRTHFF